MMKNTLKPRQIQGFSLKKEQKKGIITDSCTTIKNIIKEPFTIGLLVVAIGYPSFLLFCSFLGGFSAVK